LKLGRTDSLENGRKGAAKYMKRAYRIIYVDQPDDTAWKVIGGGIQDFNTQQAGDGHGKPLCFLLYSPGRELVGGVIGETHWDWLYINLMFVHESLRGMGYGRQLLAHAEEEARKRGAKNVYLDTFSFQAPDFYKKLGYRVFGELQDFPPGHQRFYLAKEL
jgi:GNAT superfamily N-acetyltransferase